MRTKFLGMNWRTLIIAPIVATFVLATVYWTPASWSGRAKRAWFVLTGGIERFDASTILEQGTVRSVHGINNPHLFRADQVDISRDEEVIGVNVNGQYRAYLISALSKGPETHIVNDFAVGTPVTVTYCDMNDCARVLTTEGSQPAMRLACGGFLDDQLQLLLDGVRYPQTSKLVPFLDLAFERTTWHKWSQEHQDTLVFIGLQPDARIAASPSM